MARGKASPAPRVKFNQGALWDLIIIMAVLISVKQTLLPFSLLYAGPASTLTAMAVGTFLLRRRGLSWKELGFRWPKNWWKTIGFTVLTFATFILVVNGVSLLVDLFFEDVGTGSRFDHIEGNLEAYIGIMVLVWTHGSFFEELLFRAFIINRVSSFLGGGLKAGLIAAVFSAVFFGYRHYYYQGMHGAFLTGIGGLVLALFYLWFGRQNILPLILAHGIMNSLGQTFRFLGIKD